MRHLVVWLLVACGRLEFDPVDAAPPDAALCPSEYLYVAGNAALGTTPFCVMRFEAKAKSLATGQIEALGCDTACTPNSFVTTHVPASVPEGLSWNSIDAIQAQLRCRALGTGYDLMANREWMTIAREAELVGANWSSGTPGVGQVVQGNTDSAPGHVPISDPADPYSNTGNSAAQPAGMGWEQRRTIALASGDVIWDLPGNYQEWIDWTLGDDVNGAPTPCTNAELPVFSCAGISADDFNSSTGTYDSSNGVGAVVGGMGDATRRGGQPPDLSLGIAGIYALNMNRFMTDVFPGTGFRCVLRL